MKPKSVLRISFLLLLIHNVVNAQTTPSFKFNEISYGVYSSESTIKEKMDESPSGTHNVAIKQILKKKTNRIHAEVGVEFGTEYKLTGNTNDTTTIEIEWVFPKKMIDNDKNSFERIRYSIDLPINSGNASTYTLENSYEVIVGDWLLNIYSDNKIIYSKKFSLY